MCIKNGRGPQRAAHFLLPLTAALTMRPVGIVALVNIQLACCLTTPLWPLSPVLKHRSHAKGVLRMPRQTEGYSFIPILSDCFSETLRTSTKKKKQFQKGEQL